MSRQILAIVGSSKATEKYHYDFIENYISKLPEDVIIITGDADGVDLCVRLGCQKYSRSYSTIYSKEKTKESFKQRNQVIANYADRVISMALPKTKTSCYHCNRDSHERTGGCWTGKMNGNYQVIVLPDPTTFKEEGKADG